MTLQIEQRVPARWALRRVVPAAFVAQTLVSLVAWFLVDDRPDGSFSNTDFAEWLTISSLSMLLLAALALVTLRRWQAVVAVAAGGAAAVGVDVLVFIAYAVFNSV